MPSGWSSYIWLSSPIANKYPEDVKPYKDRIKYKKHNFLGSATHMSYSEQLNNPYWNEIAQSMASIMLEN